MRTAGVKALVNLALGNVPKPYTEDVIDDVFFEIESSPELRTEYDTLCVQLGKATVNTWGGYWIANALGKTGLEQTPASKSKLIQSYSRLTAEAIPTGKKRKEPEALELMSKFYLEHKSRLPAHIRNNRNDIVEMLIAGLPVEQVFAMQIDATPPAPPPTRRR
ncbi:MAG: hypothetical protein ABIS68_06325 [Casimicrobiaceae bacterium]